MKIKMRRSVKVTAIILCAVLLISAVFAAIFLASLISYKTKDKAVIILPGLFASGLYDTATGDDVWDAFSDTDLWYTDVDSRVGGDVGLIFTILSLLARPDVDAQLKHITANDFTGDGKGMLALMAMNDDGTPKVSTVKAVPFESSSRLRYGAINTHTDMYNTLNAKYGGSHYVEVFNYDFRLDNRESALLLEEHINKKKYKEVIFVSHSNGGVVAANYLARSQKNRDKVKLNISISTPYFGSFSAISNLENIDNYIADIETLLRKNAVLSKLADGLSTAFETQFKQFINMWAVYQLLPSFDLLKTQQYYYEHEEVRHGFDGEDPIFSTAKTQKAFINIDGKDKFFNSAQELYDFYLTRPWAYIKDENGNDVVRPPLKDWLAYQEASFVTMPDGSRVHSTSLVDTRYLGGLGYNNMCKAYYETKTVDGEKILVLSEKRDTTEQGDGTVMLFSATAGTKDIARIFAIPYANHYDLAQRFNVYSAPTVLSIMDGKLKGWDKFVNKIY